MKKYLALLLVLLLGMAGCGGNKQQETAAASAGAAEKAETTAAEEIPVEQIPEEELTDAMGTVADITKMDLTQYVQPGQYTGLKVDLLVQEVNEDAVDNEAYQLQLAASTKEETDAPAKEDDYLDISYQLLADETVVDEDDDYQLLLGYCEMGEDIDAALVGAKAGDVVTVPVDVGSLYGLMEFENADGRYEIHVKKVYRYTIPELDDAMVKAATGFDTVEAYKENVRATLKADQDRNNHYMAEENALQIAVENASFNGYDESLYSTVLGELQTTADYYSQMVGMEPEDVFGMSVEDAALYETQVMMLVNTIAKTEDLVLTDEAYEAYLQEYYKDFGYETVEALKAGTEEAFRRNYALRSMVGTFIMDHSEIVELSENEYYAKYGG